MKSHPKSLEDKVVEHKLNEEQRIENRQQLREEDTKNAKIATSSQGNKQKEIKTLTKGIKTLEKSNKQRKNNKLQ